MKFSWLDKSEHYGELSVREENPLIKSLDYLGTKGCEFVNVLIVTKQTRLLGKIIMDSRYYFPEKVSVTLIDSNVENTTLRKLDSLTSRANTLVFLDSPDKEEHKTVLRALNRYPSSFKYVSVYAF